MPKNPARGSLRRGSYPGGGSATNEWRWRTLMASGVGVTSRTHPPGLSPVKVSVASISVLRGNAFVFCRYRALRDASSL
jgi:hypothetical protein